MTVPLATTTISVFRGSATVDPEASGYDDPAPAASVVASDVRATITQPSATRGQPTDETEMWSLSCDPFTGGLKRGDQVLDLTTGTAYLVDTVFPSPATTFGLNHYKAKLKIDKGVNDGTAQF